MTKKYRLLQNWLGGQYVVMKETEVFFERNITSYMVFHEGKIKVSNAIFEFDGTPPKEYFEEIKEEQPAKEYQTYLRDCDCRQGSGVIIKDDIPVCRWCRTPYASAGMMRYKDEHFKQQTNTIPLGEKYKQWDIPMNATIKESQPKTERMSVIYFEFDLDKKWLKLHFNKLELSVKKDYSKIKNSIEKILNNE